MQSINEFFERNDISNINDLIHKYAVVLTNNVKIKMMERIENPNVEYWIKDECDKFILELEKRTGMSKDDLKKLI